MTAALVAALTLGAFGLGYAVSDEINRRARTKMARAVAELAFENAILRDRLAAGGRTRAESRRIAERMARDAKTAELRAGAAK